MSAPFGPPEGGQQQAPDPSQIFSDPSQLQAMQGGEPGEPQEAQQGPPQGQEPPPEHGEALNVEHDILEAIEAGCRLAIAATDISAEDFMRFAQGVQFLTAGLRNLQPQAPPADPLAAAQLGAAQRHAAALLQHAGAMQSNAVTAAAAAERPAAQ